MVNLSSYQITKQLHESPNSKVYLGQHKQDHRPIVIKILQSEYPTPQQLAQFHNEYEFTKELNLAGIRKAIELTEIEHKYALLLEYVPGETLKHSFVEQRRNLIDFLKVASQIAQTLGEIHQRNIIHKDINVANILFEAQQQQIKIIDFGLASRINLKSYHLGNPGRLEGTLAYISPEQTGRMNRAVDYRTDLYSLGVTFYEMLTGRLPFSSDDPLELVHAHIAKNPVPPHQLRPEIPVIISQIVMKLLAKNAEDRYQSAFGLKYDLDQCLSYLQDNPDDPSRLDFELARHDFSGRFQIPQKLYGREQEIETLLRAFERVTSAPVSSNGQKEPGEPTATDGALGTGSSGKKAEFMLVAGYAGVGKSVLVHEVHKPITEKRGYFIEGKFDQFQRNIPYYAWAQAFKSWVNLLLTENETTRTKWKNKILEAVGNIGQILLEIIPNLELIIGPQPPAPELGGLEAQNRFSYLFQNFIKAIAQPDQPLVIFIDDWQWADPASLNLFKLLLSDPNLESLLLICAYRDNEVDPTHPFMLALEELRQTGAVIHSIQLHNLNQEHVHTLVADTLSSNGQFANSVELRELSNLVYEKTLGNAFFVNEFIKSLYTEGLLQFDFAASQWSFNVAKIKELNITDNVVELLASKVLKLPQATQDDLKLAACVGNQFDVETLSVVAEASSQEISQSLLPALQEGVIIPLLDSPDSASYQFVHDRIQHAAYSLIPDQDKGQVHLRVGRLLLQNIPPQEREERIFEIVNQLNFGLELLDQPSEKVELAELNLLAGRKAKTATAYIPAFNYFQTGLNLLEPASWQTNYRLCLDLYTEAAETAYLNGNFDLMGQLTDTILQQAGDILDKVRAYQITISAKAGQNQAAEAISVAFECLAQLLNWTLPLSPTPADVQQGLQATMARLAGKKIEDLGNLPVMTNPHSQAAMAILSLLGAVAYRTDMRLALLIAFKMMDLSLTYGNTKASPYAYASYGFILCSLVQDFTSGYRFGQLSLELIEPLEAKAYHARTLMVIQPLINHWQDPARESLQPLLEMYQLGLETGDLQAAAVGIGYYASYAYFVGVELTEFARKIESYREPLRRFKQTTSLNKINLYLQITYNLINATNQPFRLLGPFYIEEEMLGQHLAIRDSTTLYHHYLAKMTLSFLFEDYQQARTDAAQAVQYISAASGQLLVPIFHFYDALIQLANYADVDETEQAAILAKVTEHQQKMERWSKSSPANHAHKFYLIEAERYRVLGQAKEAREYYDLALQTAKANNYINEEALAAELAGKFYLAKGDTFLGEVYLRRAYQACQHWGATAKIKQLEAKYPHFVSATALASTKQMTVSSTSTGQTTSQLLDLSTILRASQTLADEVDLSQLLAKIIKLVVENAGAEQGFLLLEKDGSWYIEAEYHVQDQAVKVLQSIPIETAGDASEIPQVPTEIINYVVTTKEVVVLNNAAVEGQFSRLAYMKSKQSKSVLCLLLLHQAKLAGLLYLENNLITGAFTPERVELLNLLSSQMAISIENARLYTNLQQSERKYRSIFEDSRDMIFITTPNGDIIDVSPACFTLLGYTREEMIQMNAQEIYANPADRLKFRNEIEVYGSVKDLELKFRRRDGSEVDILMTATTWRAEGNSLLGYQGIVRDITEQKRAEQERLRLSVVEQELKLATGIQQSLLPPPEPGWTDLEVVCYSVPAREVGGDLYAYYQLAASDEEGGETKYAVAVGDVTGKGMPAALLMAVSLASLSSSVRQALPPHKLLAYLDTALVDYTHLSSQNCALVYAEISRPAGEESANSSLLRLANAGCPTPLVKRNNGAVEWIEIGGLPLGVGLGAEIGYPEAEVHLAKGDILILTSDGVVEARNETKELYGFERLYLAVKRAPQTSAEAMLEFLKAEVARFVGSTEPHDDLTIVVVRI